MLSIVDLMDAGTISPDLAAYLLAAIGNGASFMVGALPGGAGKTTVMGALLNFVPPTVQLAAADGAAAIAAGAAAPDPTYCYICHEIGAGPYYAYLWGSDLRAYFELPAAGHMLATNLHADTYAQARDQVCGHNGVSAEAWRRMNLMLFLSVRRTGLSVSRLVEEVWASDGASDHRRIYTADGTPLSDTPLPLATADQITRARKLIDTLAADGARTIQQVRAAIVNA